MLVDFGGEILIPKGDVGDFAVVACDQFTSDPEYWNRLSSELPSGSALDFVLPECFLDDAERRVAQIKINAERALSSGRFETVKGAIAVTRKTKYGRTRRGVVASVDVDAYDYIAGNSALIRASERTVEERIPPRVAIRKAIDIELPHILLLVDDPDGLLEKAVDASQKSALYDADLRAGGGHITGELIENGALLYDAVNDIIAASERKFGTQLFALVGDGNHSLATAKRCHEEAPTPLNGRALVEIVNIYDEGLVFEPIHRSVSVDDPVMFLDSFRSAIKGSGKTRIHIPDPVEMSVPENSIEAITAVDKFCETYIKHFGGSVDYVHGEAALKTKGRLGIEMRCPQRSEIFDYVVKHGVLPKKTFSLGEAEEKRYYIEARRIK